MELTKEQLLAHIQELQCRYVKYFNKYMTSISYGGKPSFCCFENLQAVKNYIRILKNSYSEYHYDCTTTPGENGECCTICDLSGGQLTVDSIIVNGITYDNPATTPAPFNLFINSYLTFDISTLTWYPIYGDDSVEYTFDCTSNVLNLIVSPDNGFINLNFNCLGTGATGYTIYEDDEGILQDVILNFSVTEDFEKDCSSTGCCQLSNLEGNTLNAIGYYIYSGVDAGYIPSTNPEFEPVTLEFINSTEVIVTNDLGSETYTYTYNSITGYLEISDGTNSFINFTCSFDKIVSNRFLQEFENKSLITLYFELTNVPVNSTCSGGEECKPVYSYCLTNNDIQNIIDKSYAILSQYCNC
jgi:hypothetical protein